jgi:hypothetical protein
MQPLGSAALVNAYHARITSSHDYDISVEVLTMEEQQVAAARLVDGQINILRDADVRRTATLTLLDPDRSLELDSDSPLEGALFADRMVRIRHYVDVPGFGIVAATPFVGPITKLNRNGATIDLECQDKTGLAILGCPPYTVAKGALVVDAIRNIMAARTGETRFRLPTGYRLRLTRAYSVGWPDEASPWAVCSAIARAAGLQLFYSSDGYLTLRPRPTGTTFVFNEVNLTSSVAGDNDFAGVVNYGRATAGDKIVKYAIAPTDHPLSPTRLGRNGVPRYLPSLAELDEPNKPNKPGSKHRKASKAQLKKYAVEMEKYDALVTTTTALAQRTSNALLAAGLPTNTDLTWSAVPVFHLDVDDPVRLTTEGGTLVLPFAEASIPLVSGDMSGGLLRRVSRPGRLRR